MKFPEHTRVLYAEDNEDGCNMVTIMLGFSGIEVVTAKTVARAWSLAQTENFDLYLLDSDFPDGDGLILCRRLREFAPDVPILIYSANAFESDVKDGLAAGANAYLIKPYFEDLALSVRENIRIGSFPKMAAEIIREDVQLRI